MGNNIGDESAGNLRSRRDFFKTTGQVVAATAIAGRSNSIYSHQVRIRNSLMRS